MPQTTIKNPNVGWGIQYFNFSLSTTKNYQSVSPQAARGSAVASWLNFTGITIPQGSTINSANLNIHACTGGQYATPTLYQRRLAVALANASAPASPPAPFLNGPGAPPDFGNQYIDVSNVLTYTIGLATGLWAPGPPTPVQPGAGSYNPYVVDVQSNVQSLVTAYSYSNDNMMFYLRASQSTEFIYEPGRGATKEPSLVINYTLPPSQQIRQP